jgi:hypothetical protein
MRIAFLQDFFSNEIIGGAEKNDSVLFNYLADKVNIKQVHTYEIEHQIENYDFFIVSNFINLPDGCKEYLIKNQNYIIYEHDHKYVVNRNPGFFKDYKAPEPAIINKDFYASAKKVFVLSKICKEVIELNLGINNVESIGCSLWSQENLEFIRATAKNTEKKHKVGVLKSDNKVKGMLPAIEVCKENNIEPYLIYSPNYQEFIKKLASCETFLFLPQVLETFSRVCVEAKMLNCSIMTTPKLIGFFSEPYSSLSGDALNFKIQQQNKIALEKFEEAIKK